MEKLNIFVRSPLSRIKIVKDEGETELKWDITLFLLFYYYPNREILFNFFGCAENKTWRNVSILQGKLCADVIWILGSKNSFEERELFWNKLGCRLFANDGEWMLTR